ncbi:hypothetical protein Tco_1338206 [Tanacetum coccineum]
MATVSSTTATTCKDSSKSKTKRGFTSNKTKNLPGSIAGMVMTSNNVTLIASLIPLIMEYLVKISKKARILELK